MSDHGSPMTLLKSQMAPKLILWISCGSKNKEPRCTYLEEARASHSQRMWVEISSSIAHLLHVGLSTSPRRWRCLLRVLCPVRRPVTALAWVLLKDKNFSLAPRLGSEMNSWACLGVSPRPRHLAHFWLNNQWLSRFWISRLETPRASSCPRNPITELPLVSPLAISFPRTPACPRTQNSPTAYRVEIFNALWHCSTKGDVRTACKAFSAA